ncbi:hypothetical protein [Hyphomonas oceanitis]|uniref:hypothetical protein n=1 Tax=Hyphomonas oceanitis TaxID=81033 RepID=UPI0012EBF276|nr:hypothetical protein [Hyphomonas oceanitis]
MEFNALALIWNANVSPKGLGQLVLEVAGEFEAYGSFGDLRFIKDENSFRHFIFEHMAGGRVDGIIFQPISGSAVLVCLSRFRIRSASTELFEDARETIRADRLDSTG